MVRISQFMFKIFSELRIKYSDHGLLFIPVVYFLILSLVMWIMLDLNSIPFILALLLLIVILIQIHLYRRLRIDMNHQQRNTQALIDIHSRHTFRLPLPSLDNWTASPELIARIYYLIKMYRPEVIVELGSGASTICCGYFVEKLGSGTVVSMDHDDNFTKLTRINVHNHELDNFVTVHHSPLINYELDGIKSAWYDISVLDGIGSIDMLIIDGPPEKTQPFARYPALPLLYPRLSKNAVIILDDASRQEEQEIVKRWTDLFGDLEPEFIPSEKGICVLKRGS
jgi:predicted O-methyltransferase YrrM